MSSIRLIPFVVERDVRILFSDAFLVGIMFANFAIDLFVTAATFGRLIPRGDYFLYIAPGSNFITASVAAFQSGRDVWREKYIKDLTSYLLSLPVPRRVFAFSRVLGGIVRSLIATFPGTLVISYLYGILFDPRVFAAFLIVALFSLGIVGISITVSSFASSIEMFVTIRSAVQLYLSFFSTLFYDISVFPAALTPLVAFNPMTWAVEAFRSLPEAHGLLGPVTVLVVPSLSFAVLGTVCYLWYAKL